MPSQHHKKGQHQSHSIGRSGDRTLGGLSDSFVLTGSELLGEMPKLYLTGYESWRAEKEIKEALQTNMFKAWPVELDEEKGEGKNARTESKDESISNDIGKKKEEEDKRDHSALQVGHKKMQIDNTWGKENERGSLTLQSDYRSTQNEKRKGKHNETPTLPTAHKGIGLRTREEIEREWKAKEERDIAGRARVPNGYEDVMEMEALRSLDGFKPSLLGVVPEDYQRGQSTDEESEGETWGLLHRKQPEQVTRRGYGKKQSEAEEGVAVLEGIAKNDARMKIDTRNANNTPKDVATSLSSKAEQKECSNHVPKRLSAPSYKPSFQGARCRRT